MSVVKKSLKLKKDDQGGGKSTRWGSQLDVGWRHQVVIYNGIAMRWYEYSGFSSINDPKNIITFKQVQEVKRNAYPSDVVDIGLKSVRPSLTNFIRVGSQSSLESQVRWQGTSTGTTWIIPPHCTMTTRAPRPPRARDLASRCWSSDNRVGSLSRRRVSKGVVCACLTVNLISMSVIYLRSEGNKRTAGGILGGDDGRVQWRVPAVSCWREPA